MNVKLKLTRGKISPRRTKHHPEHYFGPKAQEVTCPYCSKTLNAIDRLLKHLEIAAQEGDWNIETCAKMQKEETTRDKWAQILLRMKGNIPEICLRQPKYSQQGTEERHTKASDRKNRNEHNNKKRWKDRKGKNGKRRTQEGRQQQRIKR